MGEYLLEMLNITKDFPGVKALNNVNFKVKKGEIHALIGENGAGKSTLMKILSGLYTEYKGQIIIDNKEYKFTCPDDAHKAGVSIVTQELSPVPDLNIAQNIFLGKEPRTKFGFLDWKELYRKAEEVMEAIDFNCDPRQNMGSLSVAMSQMVEIIKATAFESRIIIFDEPTSALADSEVSALFNLMRKLKDKGITIIYISHKLKEILQICDRMTVLRDGQYIGTYDVEGAEESDIVYRMVGRTLDNIYPEKDNVIGETVLSVRSASRAGEFEDVSFDVHSGEIFGITGMMGAGRTELVSAIAGLSKLEKGTVTIDGKALNIKCVKDALKNGIVMVPEDRRNVGLVTEQSITDNIATPNMDLFASKNLWIISKALIKAVNEGIQKFSIKTPSANTIVRDLSGGNQQKVVLAKWLVRNIKVLIMDEPTRGIDVGAKHEIYKIMLNLAKQGIAIIMISSEMPEVLGMSDRVLVMAEGKVCGECPNKDLTQEKIMQMIVEMK